jgi:hypothetical protein
MCADRSKGSLKGAGSDSGALISVSRTTLQKSLFSASEQSDIILLAYKLQTDKEIEHFLGKLERIFLNKLCESSETERLLGLNNGK